MPAPILANWVACSYTMTSMPTRLSAAAVASPPMPAPTIATESRLVIASPLQLYGTAELPWSLSRLCRPESGTRQRSPAFVGGECVQEGLHRRTLLARRHEREIIMLLGERNEAKIRGMRDRRNGDTPIGTMLRYGGGDRIV